jgi:prepilin-type N-terminal cleavage/methylation domain-containing protein
MPAVTRARRGFTLAEILVALTLVGFVVGGILAIVVKQQRFYAGAADMIDLRDNIRTIGDLLPAELRAASPRDGDLIPFNGAALTDSALDFRATTGASVVCTIPAADAIIIPPYGSKGNAGLTSWISQPVVGDSIYVLLPGLPNAKPVVPDSMIPYEIKAITTAQVCPVGSGFTATASEAAQGMRIELSANLVTRPDGRVHITGAPLRFHHRVKYSLYRSTADGKWYLGYRDFNDKRAAKWSAIQPVAGPLLPYSTSGASGLSVTYHDSAGTQITSVADARRIRRVDMTVRGQTSAKLRTEGLSKTANGFYRDSLRVSVALRNY